MRLLRLSLVIMILLGALVSAHAQDYSKFNFVIGGGPGFPLGDMSSFADTGGHFLVGGGFNFSKIFGLDTEFMWHDLPINSATRQLLQTPGATARQYSVTVNPIVHLPFASKFGAYVIGGIGWYHRSGETTTPGTGVVCDPYWSWWYGCAIGSVDFVTGSRSADAFGGNIGGGLTFRLGESHAKIFTEVRYHHAGYDRVSTNLLPLSFGIRW
jgi:outer membrane protein with beta-barrel domain